MKILYDQRLMNNEVSEEELLSKEVEIFLFNIHFGLVTQFPSVYKDLHKRIYKEMLDNQEIGDYNEMFESATSPVNDETD